MLYIQDPNYHNSRLLNDVLLEIMGKANKGFATYAFVTKEGLQLIFDNEVFKEFITRENSSFLLVMGIDEVTNERTLEEAKKLKEEYKNLEIKVFLETETQTTYHPKFAAFEISTGGSLIIGSGNLTLKGLRKNREAYTVANYPNVEFEIVVDNWNEWLKHNEQCLKDLDDEEVIKKAEENSKLGKSNARKRKRKKELENKNEEVIILSSEDESDAWEFTEQSRALVAELSRNRWGQAGFHKETIRDFYGVDADNFIETLVILRIINTDGISGELENRVIKYKPGSKNYYFEITTPDKSTYPNDGNRPIIVFVEVSLRTYLYMLLMPDDANYAELKEFMVANRVGNKCAQEIITVEHLKKISPNLHLLEYLERYDEIE